MDDSDFVDLEEGSGETGEISNVCLVGKVLGTKMFNGPVSFFHGYSLEQHLSVSFRRA